MTTILQFIEARLGEVRADADYEWHLRDCQLVKMSDMHGWCTCDASTRILRNVAVDMAILAEHVLVMRYFDGDESGKVVGCMRCTWSDYDLQRGDLPPDLLENPCVTLRLIASRWAEHGDYNPEWAVPVAEPKTLPTLRAWVDRQGEVLARMEAVVAEVERREREGAAS